MRFAYLALLLFYNAGMFAANESDSVLQLLRHLSVEEVLRPVLVVLIVIVVSARVFAALFRRLGQPSVVGEVVAGLVLGPSVLGKLWPAVFTAIFRPSVGGAPPEVTQALLFGTLTILSQLGLIFLLFLVGMEFDFSHLRKHGKAALSISIIGIAAPFVLGLALAPLLITSLGDPRPQPVGFTLFLGTALSITAIPVLARMMMEMNITSTRLGAITIAAAAVDDACGWILLATVAAVVQAALDLGNTAAMVAATIGFTLVMVYVVRPLLERWLRTVVRLERNELSVNSLTALLAILFICAIATNLIGIFAIFGAFVLGAVLSQQQALRDSVSRRLRDFVTAFFVPIFFTFTGLRTDMGSLNSGVLWLLFFLVVAAAVIGKLGGCTVAARWSGLTWRESACIGAMMNTRGLMALIVVNLGKDLGVIPDSVYCMLTLTALVTTAMTTPLLRRWMTGTELENAIRKSGFPRSASQ